MAVIRRLDEKGDIEISVGGGDDDLRRLAPPGVTPAEARALTATRFDSELRLIPVDLVPRF